MARRVLTDASPLIGLARVDGLPWLRTLFGTVLLPSEVHAEVLSGRKLPDEQAIDKALADGYLRLCGPTPPIPALPELDAGETACIRHALLSTPPALILIDERAGRAIAREHNIPVTGTAAIIGMAKLRGLIPSAREVFTHLHASDFRISATVIETILKKTGE